MKSILILFCFFATYAFTQSQHAVRIHVNMLGKMDKSVRYYHPATGDYNIWTNYKTPDKAVSKLFNDFVYVEPAHLLKNGVTELTSASLRYKMDPSELIYVNWDNALDTLGRNTKKLTAFKEASKEKRTKKYQVEMQKYFNPFFISKHEITNREYREFVRWVQDSIFRETLLFSELFYDNEIVLLHVPKGQEKYWDEEELEWLDYDPYDPEEMRKFYSLNYEYDYWKEVGPQKVHEACSELYLPEYERYYRRRDIDTRKLNFLFYTLKEVPNRDSVVGDEAIRSHVDLSRFIEEHKLNVYPDTSQWKQFSEFACLAPMAYMYFWHPAFDDYPVVNISKEQAEAYCFWKSQMLRNENPELMRNYELALPSAVEYEWTTRLSTQALLESAVLDMDIIPDLSLLSTESDASFEELLRVGAIPSVQEVMDACADWDTKSHKKLSKKLEEGYKTNSYPYKDIKDFIQMRASENYLSSGVKFLSNNVSEWMSENYEDDYAAVVSAYFNYHIFQDPEKGRSNMHLEQLMMGFSQEKGHLIQGSNWYDERYGESSGVNTKGIYAKTFRATDSSFPTVGFRMVIRPINPF